MSRIGAWSHRRRGHTQSPFTRRVAESDRLGPYVWSIDCVHCSCGRFIDLRRRIEK